MPQAQDNETVSRAAQATRYDSLLVHVEPGMASSRRVEVAAGLARRFDARLIGLGAEMIEPVAAVDPYGGQLLAEVIVEMTKQVEADLDSAKETFRRDGAEADSEWRTARMSPAKALIVEARAADLIVMGGEAPAHRSPYRAADAAEVAMSAGRPVLIAPANPAHLSASRIVIAWKDTREARRAVADALPFLLRAEDVLVMAVCGEDDLPAMQQSADDVVSALRRRGVPARSHVVSAPDASVVDELNAEAASIGADLIVAGAYGHSRMAEWAFGGVTRTLLDAPARYVLISH